MKFVNLLGVLLLFVCSILPSHADSIYSKGLQQSFEYEVALPDGYQSNSEKSYPLLLVLDGQNYGRLMTTNAEYMAYSGDIPEHIIVSLTVINRLKHYTPTDSPQWFGDGGGPEFLKFVEFEFMPHLESSYRISDNRIMWGHSAAGLFAMHSFLEDSKSFNGFLVNDAPLDWDSHLINKRLDAYLDKTNNRKKFLYLNHSYLNPNVEKKYQYMPPIIETLQKKQQGNLRWDYQPFDAESHSSVPIVGGIDGLKAFYKGYRIPDSITAQGLTAVQSYFKEHASFIGAKEKIDEFTIENTAAPEVFRKPTKAIATLKFGIELYPQSAQLHIMLTDAYEQNKDIPQAIRTLSKAIGLVDSNDTEQIEMLNERLQNMKEQKH